MSRRMKANDAFKLPSPVLTMASHAEESVPTESIDQHEGRKRSFPHERGIWASYVYINCNDIDGLREIQDECGTLLNTCTTINFKPIDPMHLSLTKTFTIHHHNIAPFVNNVQEMFAPQQSFRLEFDGVDVYVNEERTRTFVGVRLAESCRDKLESFVSSLDECLQQYKLPIYYADRSFHVSILWCLNDRAEEVRKYLEKLNNVFERVYEEEYREMNKHIKSMWFKSGNKQFYFKLV